MRKPDYEKLSHDKTFLWGVSGTYPALVELTGIPMKEFYLTPSAGVELFKKGIPALKEIYPEKVGMPPLMTPPISYGHANTLGVELIFPEDGEVNHGILGSSLDECVDILKRPVDFAKAGMLPFYMEYRERMKEAFPGENIGLHYIAEGPITTAYVLRRDELFFDPYDDPEKTKEFFQLLTESIVEFNYFKRELDGQPRINPDGAGVCDDIASMFNPSLWEEFVIPYLDLYFEKLTTGMRGAHIEDLRPEQLCLLEKLYLESYDPSVSPKINPEIISARTRVPFGWRLCDFHYPELSEQDVSDFVFKAAADGASRVFTYVTGTMLDEKSVRKVYTFINAAEEVEKCLKGGAKREELLQSVSESGMKKFWSNWP